MSLFALHRPASPPLPSLDQLLGQWYITHTSSPVWFDKRNVLLTYTSLSPSNRENPSLDNRLTYQTLASTSVQTIHGTDTPSTGRLGAWTWRGTGWLKFVTSHWEILGHGELGERGRWIVVFAQKSLFTPAVLNVCTRSKEGLSDGEVCELKRVIMGLGDEDLGNLVDGVYSVKQE